MSSDFNIAIIGATGVVGSTLMSILDDRKFPIDNLYLLASERSAGETRIFRGKTYTVQDINDFDFSKTRFAFFCAGNDISAQYAPKAADAGNIVLDKSSYFRYHDDVPLVVPEVNLHVLKNLVKGIVASPNCNTIPIAVALKPIYDAVGISRINIATYQSVSGTGKDALVELTEQTKQVLNNEEVTLKIYPQQIAFNVLPHIDQFEENGYTREEMKIVWEMQKIFGDKSLAINPTTVRVPVYYGHSAAVHLETKNKITATAARELMSQTPGITVIEPYPTPVKEAAGRDDVYVGRIREDISHPNGLAMWVVADNVRKGAALNTVQIADGLISHYLSKM